MTKQNWFLAIEARAINPVHSYRHYHENSVAFFTVILKAAGASDFDVVNVGYDDYTAQFNGDPTATDVKIVALRVADALREHHAAVKGPTQDEVVQIWTDSDDCWGGEIDNQHFFN